MAVRTLSVKEIFIVSGGADSSEPTILPRVTVTGTKGPILDPYNLQSTLDYFSIYDNYGQDQGSGESGSDGSESTVVEPAKTEEQMIDELAQNLAAQIMAMPDWQQREYVAVLYKLPDGTVVATAIYPGLTNGTASEATKLALIEAGGIANLGNIIGMIHNHPASLINSDYPDLSMAMEKMPSDEDWATVKYYFDNRTDFALYLVGPDGELREYENSDRAIWEARNDPSYYDRNEGLYDKWLDSEQGIIP